MRKAQDVVFLWRVMLCAKRVASLCDAFYVYRSNPYSVMKQQTRARVAFSDRILRGYEIYLMLGKYEVLPPLAENMRNAVRWCANSSIELLRLMPKEEKMLYFDEIMQMSLDFLNANPGEFIIFKFQPGAEDGDTDAPYIYQ